MGQAITYRRTGEMSGGAYPVGAFAGERCVMHFNGYLVKPHCMTMKLYPAMQPNEPPHGMRTGVHEISIYDLKSD